MSTKFSDFMKEIEEEARAEGPEAIDELEALKKFFREKLCQTSGHSLVGTGHSMHVWCSRCDKFLGILKPGCVVLM